MYLIPVLSTPGKTGRILKIVLLFVTFLHILSSIEAVLTKVDEDFFGYEADRYDWTKHPCKRECVDGQEPMTCRYVFVVEQYSSMSKACYDCPFNQTDCSRPHCIPADGNQKMLVVVNRQLPGPLVEVCQNDTVEVEVRNRMMSESCTIHWHGFKQLGTPYMDGVPYVTQCPILPGTTFRYVFNATSMGTFFYHSHMGNQRLNGFFGPLLVKRMDTGNVFFNDYDYDDLRMVITDWSGKSADDEFFYQFHYFSNVTPTNILINGLGPDRTYERNGTTAQTPYAVFNVKQDDSHRIRLINAGSGDCPIKMSIDNHTLLVIALDGNFIEPVRVDEITSWPGERYDFILEANQTVDNYWIRYKGYALCRTNATVGVFQTAILRYEGANITIPTEAVGYEFPIRTNTTRILNPYDAGTETSQQVNITIPTLNSTDENDESLSELVDQQFYISFDFYPENNYDYHRKKLYGFDQVNSSMSIGTLQFNHISYQPAPFPLLSQYDMLDSNSFCNADTIKKSCSNVKIQCSCTHVLEIGLNNVVEFVFIDEGRFVPLNHPLHMHGEFMRVIASVNLEGNVTAERIREMDEQGLIERKLDKAPFKDTMRTPGGGYTIARFTASNPGYWFFHCHFEDHNNIGMALVLKVGEHEDFPEKPENFPQCGNFLPTTP